MCVSLLSWFCFLSSCRACANAIMMSGRAPSSLLLLLAVLVGCCTASVTPPTQKSNILMLLPVSSKSHRNVFMPLATALTKRGHKITMLCNHPAADDNPDIEYINHGLPHFKPDDMNMFKYIGKKTEAFNMFTTALPKMARDLYTVPAVKKLYEERKKFDLIIVNLLFNELVYPFVHEQPFVTLATSGIEASHSSVTGNTLNPAYVGNMMEAYSQPMSFVSRAKNLFMSIYIPFFWRHWAVLPLVQAEISKHFPDLPSLVELQRNQSLVLLNSHFSTETVLPLLPSQVEVGGMHCRPGRPLPEDISKFVTSDIPVVYFSLGSVAKSTTMPTEYRNILLEALKQLPYKILWKFEENFPGLPKNIMIKKWLPQQDILAHPNVKLFISHCGLLSVQESLYHGTPILGIPVYGDQPKNCKGLEHAGMAITLQWEKLTVEGVKSAITKMVIDESYARNVRKVSEVFKDQKEHPVDRAVYWTEYVIRHRGAHHLRSPEIDLTWIELLNLDVLLSLLLIVYLTYKLLSKCLKLCFSGPDKITKKKKKE